MPTKRSIRWSTWLAWSPLAVFALWYLGLPAICGNGPCIGRAGLPVINELFSYSKWLLLALVIATLIVGLLRKLTKLGWVGFVVSFLPAMFHVLMFID
ncbi:hypothetical protein ABAC460_08380 [Asticcacaulis sp. AC460]|uniref:hypothetical protein n=1 Tax=Asticcacaulis sp. AC460 TaxID=1282360 RepID=UPI0003C3B171|nr:hypothetical protein [Asticcacaulis sp. AC460]ESQ90836.1 hypothetical protein ABAC460_08380 [Asticcacaulis sp. AC460]